MSADREMDHLENMTDMNSSRGFEPEETSAQRVADEAARRVARNTMAGVKRVALAMGVDLLSNSRFMEGHRCTSSCRREGCEVVQIWQRRAEELRK